MGYQPPNLTTHNIAYVLNIEEMKLDTESALLVHFERTVRAHGYRLTFASTNINSVDDLSEILSPKTADGVIFSRWYGGKIKNVLSPRLPWILTSDEYDVDDDVDLVALDTVQTTRNITEYLLKMGHRQFGVLVGQPDLKYHQGLIGGVEQALQEAKLPPTNLKLIRTWHISEIGSELLPLLEQADGPTALIATSPGRAFATVYALRCAGYRIPEDVSVVSVVDSERFLALPPLLTVTDALGARFAERAVERLLEKIDNPDAPAQRILLPGNVVERDSVGMPRTA